MNIPPPLPLPALFALARDRTHWNGTSVALDREGDGYLTLARVPGPADGVAIDLPGPYFPGVSGIAAGPCGIVFVADTAHHRVLIVDRRCGTRSWLPADSVAGSAPGQFDTPRGLAAGEHELSVADSGNGRIQELAFPALEAYRTIDAASIGPLQSPSGVAIDDHGRTYVLDAGWKRVCRFHASGMPDATFDAVLQAQGMLTTPLFVAVGEDDRVLVSDDATATVHVFKADGTALHTLPAPGSGWKPGAIARNGARLFVHDRASGSIEIFADDRTYCCRLPAWRGPVTALAVDQDGHLLIKTGLDDGFVVFMAGAAYAGKGTIELGPFDAGQDAEWLRAAVDVLLPMRTRARLEVAQRADAVPPPGAADWIEAPALDTLLAPLVPPVAPTVRRWLWLRVTVDTVDARVTPLLRQVRAETPGETYLDSLPAVYRKTDSQGQLARLLALMQGEQSAVDESIDDMPRVALAGFARASTLPWLAEWLDYDLPSAADSDERRELIARAVALHERRGTPASIGQILELHTGLRPAVVEGFTTRGLWILGETSRLGFDTALPASHPDGIVVPEHVELTHTADGRVQCCPVPIGSAVVGESGPLPRERFGEPLFSDMAHRFDVVVPAHRARDEALINAIRRLVEREKPAHTQFCLCVVAPEITVGFQALVGVDTIVGGGRPPFRLDTSLLGHAPLNDRRDGDVARIGMNTRIGSTTTLT